MYQSDYHNKYNSISEVSTKIGHFKNTIFIFLKKLGKSILKNNIFNEQKRLFLIF